MLYPIGIFEEFRKSQRHIKYLMYDDETTEQRIMTKKEIEENKENIKGFTFNGNGARKKGLYSNLGIIGKEPEDPNIKYYTVISKIIDVTSTEYLLIKLTGEAIRLQESKVIRLIEEGHQIAGARVNNGKLKVSSDTKEVKYKPKKYNRA